MRKKLKSLEELLESKVRTHEEDMNDITNKKVTLEAHVRILESEIEVNQEAYNTKIKDIHDEHSQEVDRKQLEIQTLTLKLNELHEFATSKNDIENKLARLEKELEDEKTAHQKDIEEMDRDKIKATEKLKKDMLYKIKQTREQVMALNDDNLHTTTRFTVLENHRLTAELEYQSKQTEKLLKRNTMLEEQLTSYKRDVEIHKQVEAELAKRSHFCQKIIKKLNGKIKELEDSLSATKRDDGQANESRQETRMNDELIKFLEEKLEEGMNQLNQVQMEYNLLKADHTELLQKTKEKHEKYRNLGCLLADYLIDLKNVTPEDDLTLNIHRIANSPVEQLSGKDRGALVVALLKQIQPYVSPTNLNIPGVNNVNIITAPIRTEDGVPNLKNLPSISVGVQTSFALGTFDLPKLEVDPELVKGPVRPWGPKTDSNQSRESSYRKRAPYRR